MGVRDAFLAKTPWTVNDLDPTWANVPVIFDRDQLKTAPLAYCGVLDGSTKYGTIIDCGPTTDPAYAKGPPQVAADPNRRSLLRTEWIEEFFKTRTSPVGHGFDLVPASMRAQGFACYSFVPKPGVPLKVIVLDDTQSEQDGSKDIHGHGYLDAERWAWLQAELAAGQAENQLMIIATHIPIAVVGIGGETEWWLGEEQTATEYRNAVSLADLVTTLQQSTNLIMWIAGHRHLNVVKAFPSDDRANFPERGFWQVETSSLRDFPQQFRTFEVFLNSDYTVSVEAVNIDPAVKHGSPAEISRRYAVAAQQLVKSDLQLNTNNTVYAFGNTMEGVVDVPVPSMDPTRLQDNSTDLSIQWVDLGAAGVPYNASYNAELYKPLSTAMTAALRVQFP
jgi:metallophosphoesterase (TIGR03768 family)